MAINKVVYDGNTLVDLTGDTVIPEVLSKGYTAHGADGEPIVGLGELAFDLEIPLSEQDVLIAQIAAALEGKAAGGGAEEEWIGDGNTHIWVHLGEGRTAPILGVCPNGTVTVDWGDGTAPDTLTGTSTSTVKWTGRHNYAAPGDYVITLTVSGSMGFYGTATSGEYSGILRYASSADGRNSACRNAVRRVEIGSGVTAVANYAFYACYVVEGVKIPDGVTSIGNYAFAYCYNLADIEIPDSVTSMGTDVFNNCNRLADIDLPDGVKSIGERTFNQCRGVVSIGLPAGATGIGGSAFFGCYTLTGISIPSGVTSIGATAFNDCSSLAKIRFNSTTPPKVANSNAFTNVPTDCVISVPVGKLSAYKSATNYPSSSKYTYIEE